MHVCQVIGAEAEQDETMERLSSRVSTVKQARKVVAVASIIVGQWKGSSPGLALVQLQCDTRVDIRGVCDGPTSDMLQTSASRGTRMTRRKKKKVAAVGE